MKKSIFLFLLLILAFCFFAGFAPAVTAGTWTDYQDARMAAKTCETNGNTDCAVANYLQAEKAALVLVNFDGSPYQARQIIADWQRNNAAYTLIKAFLKTQDYQLLREAKELLSARQFTGPPAEKQSKNLAFCEEHLQGLKEE